MLIYQNILSLDHESKGVPYGGSGKLHPDGDANYGFKDIKGKLDLLSSIPELARDAALFNLVKAISLPTTGLFSIGCVSAPIFDAKGFRHTGYVEFAFNSASYVQDASHYFPVYFYFDRALKENGFTGQIQYQWELKPAMFLVTGIDGFTCSVFLNSFYLPTEQEAVENWALSLGVLAEYLANVPIDRNDPLYGT